METMEEVAAFLVSTGEFTQDKAIEELRSIASGEWDEMYVTDTDGIDYLIMRSADGGFTVTDNFRQPVKIRGAGEIAELYPSWICRVADSSLRGTRCSPAEPHSGWGCGWYFRFTRPAKNQDDRLTIEIRPRRNT